MSSSLAHNTVRPERSDSEVEGQTSYRALFDSAAYAATLRANGTGKVYSLLLGPLSTASPRVVQFQSGPRPVHGYQLARAGEGHIGGLQIRAPKANIGG